MTEKELIEYQRFEAMSPEELRELPLADRMHYVALQEKAVGVHWTQTGKQWTVDPEWENQVSPGQPVFPPPPAMETLPTLPTEPTLPTLPAISALEDKTFGIPNKYFVYAAIGCAIAVLLYFLVFRKKGKKR